MHSLDELRHALARCAARRAEVRADLIESLGDRLCGSGDGPSPEDVDRLHALDEMYDSLRSAYDERLRDVAMGERQ